MQQAPADVLGLVGRQLGGKYRVVRPIGAGGMGVVYEALQEDLGRRVALKVLLPQLTFHSELVARFKREAQAAAALGHPHIVQVTDFGGGNAAPASGEPTYLVMELLDGQSLANVIAAQGSLDTGRTTRIAAQVLAALEVAHRAGIVHRDIKPDNVFLVRGSSLDDFVKLLDFGVAKLQGDQDVQGGQLTATGAMIGTLAYMAPEQAQGLPIDGRADLYAVGACMYHALTGRLPFQAPTAPAMLHAILQEPLTPLTRVRPDLDPSLGAVVERAMSRDPRARFATAEEMRHAIARWAGGPSTATGPSAGQAPVMITPPGQVVGVDPRGATVGVSGASVNPGGSSTAGRATSTSPLLWIGLGLGLLLLIAVGGIVAWSLNRDTQTKGVWVSNDGPANNKASTGPVAPDIAAPTAATVLPTPTAAPAKPSGTMGGLTTPVIPTAARDAGTTHAADAGASSADAGGKSSSGPKFSDKPQGGTTVSITVAAYGSYPSQQYVLDKLAPKQGALNACYAAAVMETANDGTDHRHLFFYMDVTPQGKVRSFTAATPETRTIGLETCLRGVITGIDFGPVTDPQPLSFWFNSK